MENPIKMDDLGVPLFLETPRSTFEKPFFSFLSEKVSMTLDGHSSTSKYLREIIENLWFLDISGQGVVKSFFHEHISTFHTWVLETNQPNANHGISFKIFFKNNQKTHSQNQNHQKEAMKTTPTAPNLLSFFPHTPPHIKQKKQGGNKKKNIHQKRKENSPPKKHKLPWIPEPTNKNTPQDLASILVSKRQMSKAFALPFNLPKRGRELLFVKGGFQWLGCWFP